MDIQPGDNIKVTVTSRSMPPKAQKTLARLFLKDKSIRDARETDGKPTTPTRRAGRIWVNRKPGSALIPPSEGETAKIHATLDVLRDLQSVEKHVKIGLGT